MSDFFEKQDELFKRAKNGDTTAREQMILDNIPVVQQTIYNIMKGKKMTNEDKEDEMQQGYLLAIEAIDKMLEGEIGYNVAYLKKYIQCRITDWYNKTRYGSYTKESQFENKEEFAKKRNAIANMVDIDDVKHKIEDENDIEKKVMDKMIVEQLLDKLNEDEREIIQLMFYNGYTQKEIAEIKGVSQGEISKRYNKIKLKLRGE